MCNAYAISRINGNLLSVLGMRGQDLQPDWLKDIFRPTDFVPVIAYTEYELGVRLMKWGFVPSFAKEPPKFPMTNIRGETVDERAMFKSAFNRRQRCLILANVFYEWRTVPGQKKKKRVEYALKTKETFAIAGLWDRSGLSPESDPVLTAGMLTAEANELIRPVKDRMPVLLSNENAAAWMNPDLTAQQAKTLLLPFPSDEMISSDDDT